MVKSDSSIKLYYVLIILNKRFPIISLHNFRYYCFSSLREKCKVHFPILQLYNESYVNHKSVLAASELYAAFTA